MSEATITKRTEMMPLSPKKCAFGRHETLPLRFGWLTRAIKPIRELKRI